MPENGPFTLSVTNLRAVNTPELEVSAILLLQNAGYTVLRKPPLEIQASHSVSIYEFHRYTQAKLKQNTIYTLSERLGQGAMFYANIIAEQEFTKLTTEYRARLFVVPVGEVGPAGLKITNPSL